MTARLLRPVLVLSLLLLLAPGLRAQGAGIPARDFARQLGLTVDEDPISGRMSLSGSGHVLRLCPGIDRVLFDDRVEAIAGAPFDGPVDLQIPAGALARLTELLRGPGKSNAAPGTQRGPTTGQGPRVTAPPRVAGGRIVIDPGHGGAFTGTHGASGVYEKAVTLDIAHRLGTLLEQQGWRVTLTRTADRALAANIRADLDARAQLTQSIHPDVFLSIHANHATERGPRGFEVYVGQGGKAPPYSGASRKLAQEIERALRDLGIPDRGIKEAGFYVIKWAGCPAVLVETEFLSNPAGERLLTDPGTRQRIAGAIAQALGRYRASFPGRS